MPKYKTKGHRETRKPQHALPQVLDLGVLSILRKSNRSAARYAATVGLLLGRRRVDRKARRNALRRRDAVSVSPRRQHLDKTVRLRMLGAMPGWFFDQRSKAFVPKDTAPERIEELLDAVIDLGSEVFVLRVSGLSAKEAARVRGYLQTGSELVVVNRRSCEPTFVYAAHL